MQNSAPVKSAGRINIPIKSYEKAKKCYVYEIL